MKLLRSRLSVVLFMTAFAAGCHLPQSDKVDYKSAEELPPLEVPPDLIRPATDDRYAIPAAGTNAASSYSAYATMIKGNDGADQLSVNDPFDRAWRRVGLALDQSGIIVDDRNRDKGVYRVHYDDAGAQDEKPGFFSKLFGKKKTVGQYQILVKEVASATQVSVLDKDGNADKSEAAGHLLAKLYEQLK